LFKGGAVHSSFQRVVGIYSRPENNSFELQHFVYRTDFRGKPDISGQSDLKYWDDK